MKSHHEEKSALRRLQQKHGLSLENQLKAAEDAKVRRDEIKQSLATKFPTGFGNNDLSLVIFGSLARDEQTSGSDLDWTLLVDGQADPEHLVIAQRVGRQLETIAKGPGPTGVFGNLSFSHDIIHQIGGENDTNRNTTQRLLLLLEAEPLLNRNGEGSAAYDRVISGILQRYIESDPSAEKLPRFLLNDIVRLWRTIAVDFASKQRERSGRGWGLRNAKLRLSRKLIFAAGMSLCFSYHNKVASQANGPAKRGGEDASANALYLLRRLLGRTPLEVVAQACLDADVGALIAKNIFESYDKFLTILNDKPRRDGLDALESSDAAKSELFGQVREIGQAFQQGLTELFFDTVEFRDLTREYGVF